MNWDDIRVFLQVARQGQLLGAARSLGLNHATVARRLTALEQAMGSKLVSRRNNGTELTLAGQRLLAHAEMMEAATLSAREAADLDNAVAGTVRIGAPDGFGVGFLAARLHALAQRHPSLRLELVPVPRAFSLSRREADIAITLERPQQHQLISRKLVDYRLGLFASRSYLDEHGVPERIEDLEEHRLVGYVEDLIYSASLDYTGTFLRNWRSSVAIASALGQVEAVRSGCGIGILHYFMARQATDLVAVLPDRVLTRSYWTVMHEDQRRMRRVSIVSNFLAELVAEEAAMF
jgi:DNA-binding transcriptional LysR family regulator